MSDVLERLEVIIGANADRLRQELKKGGVDVGQFARNVDRQLGGVATGFGKVSSQLRTALGAVGITFGASAFSGWIRNALDAKNMTEEQLAATKEAREALKSMKTASDELARSLGETLVPSMRLVTSTLIGWNRLAFRADPVPFEQPIEALRERIAAIRGTNIAPDGHKPVIVYTSEQKAEIERLTKDLDALIEKQRAALGLQDDVNAIRARLAANPIAGMRTLDADNLGNTYTRFGHIRGAIDGQVLRRPNVRLEELDEFQEITVGARRIGSAREVRSRMGAVEQIGAMARQHEQTTRRMEELAEATELARERQQRLADAIAASFESRGIALLLEGKPRDAIRGFAKDLAELVIRMTVLQPLAENLANSLSGIGKGGSSGSSGFVGFLGSIFGFDEGGRPPVGRPSWVGEKGVPELFVPDVAGRIYTMQQARRAFGGGAGVTVEQHFHVEAGLPPQWDAQLAAVGQLAGAVAFKAVNERLGGRR